MYARRVALVLFLLGGALSWAGYVPEQPAAPRSPGHENDAGRADRYGDPLPSGAIARLGTIRLRHRSMVNCVAFSPDGKLLASGSNDQTVALWEVATGRLVRRLSGPRNYVFSVSFSADGRLVAAASDTAFVWDVATGQQLAEFSKERSMVTSVCFAPKGHVLGACLNSDKGVRLWGIPSGEEVVKLEDQPLQAAKITFSPDGKYVAAGGSLLRANRPHEEAEIHVWDTSTGKKRSVMKWAAGHIQGLAFSRDGKTLAVSADEVSLWDLATGKTLYQRPGGLEGGVAFAPDGRFLVIGASPSGVDVLDPPSGRLIRQIPSSQVGVGSVAVSPDGSLIATGERHGQVRMWRSSTGEELHPFAGTHREAIVAMTYARDEGRVITMALNKPHALLWEVPAGTPLGAVPFDRPPVPGPAGDVLGDSASQVAVSENGRFLAIAFDDDMIIRDRLANRTIKVGNRVRISSRVRPAFSPDGQSFAAIDARGMIRVWRSETGQEVWQASVALRPELRQSMAAGAQVIAWNRDGSVVAAGLAPMSDGDTPLAGENARDSVRLWNGKTGEPRGTYRGPQFAVSDIAFAPNGLLMATVGPSVAIGPVNASPTPKHGRSIVVWDVATGQVIGDVSGTRAPTCVAFSPDSGWLVAGEEDGAVFVWETATRQLYRQFEGHESAVAQVAWADSARHLVSAGADSIALVWDVASGQPVADGTLRPTAAALEKCWRELGSADIERAHSAFWTLRAAGDQAVGLFRTHLQPAEPLAEKQIQGWIADLDHPAFAVRQAAQLHLGNAGGRAKTHLQAAIAANASAEQRTRLEALIKDLASPIPPEARLREIRSIRLLALMQSLESRKLLAALASGDSEAGLTRDARAASASDAPK